MTIKLSDHFTYGKLLRFTLPSIAMMIFTSLYNVVDGFFVSNYAGKTALAAVNLAFPFLMMLASIGFMLGAGGSALVAKTLGEGDNERANRIFSLFVWFAVGLAVVVNTVGFLIIPYAMQAMGAEGEVLEQSILYGRILFISSPAFALQMAFQSLFSTAGRPQVGLFVTIGAGCTNIFLDFLFVGVFHWGLVGAAAATVCSELTGGLVPLVYFLRPNSSTLRLGRTKWDGRALRQGCLNGLSELFSQISMSFIGMLFNAQLMRLAGENGVAAYSVLMYVNFVFTSAFLGYAVGANPIAGYSFGAGNKMELRSMLRKSLVITSCFATACTLVAEFGGEGIANIFVGYDAELLDLTRRGFRIYSLMYVFCGFPIFLSSFFTGLNNGLVSACISVSRTLIFQVSCVLILPELFGVNGIWLSVVVAEALATVVAFVLLRVCKKRYGY